MISGGELPLPPVRALRHAPETPDSTDYHRLAAYEQVRQVYTPRRPRDVIYGCGADGALGRTVEATRRKATETMRIVRKRRAMKNQDRERHNERISRASPGATANAGNTVLATESASTLHSGGVHPNLAHDHFAGPWQVVNVVRAGLSFTIRLNGRHIRQRMVAATDMKTFHRRPLGLRHPFEDDELRHYVWSSTADISATEPNTT